MNIFVDLSSSYHTDVCSKVKMSDNFGLNELFHALKGDEMV